MKDFPSSKTADLPRFGPIQRRLDDRESLVEDAGGIETAEGSEQAAMVRVLLAQKVAYRLLHQAWVRAQPHDMRVQSLHQGVGLSIACGPRGLVREIGDDLLRVFVQRAPL